MERCKTLLAWSKHPEPAGTLYFENKLVDPQTVTDLFSFCQIAGGYINADGWEFLFKTFGLSELLDLKLKSKWINSLHKEKPVSDLIYQSFMAGYNPLLDEKGDYDETIEMFLSLDGYKRAVDWDQIERMDRR